MPLDVKLKLPPALSDHIELYVRSGLKIGPIVVLQKEEAKFIDGKWHIEIWVLEPGEQLVLRPRA